MSYLLDKEVTAAVHPERMGQWTLMRAVKIRFFQMLALYAPGATTVRVWLHRQRGVEIGSGTFISTDALLETSRPDLISIGRDVVIGIRSVVIGHFRGTTDAEKRPGSGFSVRIEDEAFIGPGAILLPGVTVGRGAVVAAGSVVTSSVQPLTLVQGNPARPVARLGVPLGKSTPLDEFYRQIRPIRASRPDASS